MAYSIVVQASPQESDRLSIASLLDDYNAGQYGRPWVSVPLAIMVRDDATGADAGGLWGRTGYDWLFIDFLAVASKARGRGIGRQLMLRAEAIAVERHCIGIHLTTLELQARGFYEKLGFEVFGTLDDFPDGHKHFFMRKRLRAA